MVYKQVICQEVFGRLVGKSDCLMHMRFGRVFLFGPTSPTAGLHLQKSFAEGIGSGLEMDTGKAIAVPKAVFHFPFYSTIQNGTDTSH